MLQFQVDGAVRVLLPGDLQVQFLAMQSSSQSSISSLFSSGWFAERVRASKSNRGIIRELCV